MIRKSQHIQDLILYLYYTWTRCQRYRTSVGIRGNILYFGDFDHSDDMDDYLDNALRYFGLKVIDFYRIAVTAEHIEEFNLPPSLRIRKLLIR